MAVGLASSTVSHPFAFGRIESNLQPSMKAHPSGDYEDNAINICFNGSILMESGLLC